MIEFLDIVIAELLRIATYVYNRTLMRLAKRVEFASLVTRSVRGFKGVTLVTKGFSFNGIRSDGAGVVLSELLFTSERKGLCLSRPQRRLLNTDARCRDVWSRNSAPVAFAWTLPHCGMI